MENKIQSNGQRFLDAYNAIDKALRVRYNFKTTISFSDLVRRCASLNHVIHQHEDDLVNFARLRNAIIHNSDSACVVAEPHNNVVELLEKIARLMTTPPLVTEITRNRPTVITIEATKTIKDFIIERGGSGHGTIPVYKGTNLIGVIRWREFVANLGQILSEGHSADSFINTTSVEDLIRAYPKSGLYLVASHNVTIEEILTMFDKNSRLSCVIITNSGTAAELPVGIITNADIMYLISIIEKY